jgi:hypothetical protein
MVSESGQVLAASHECMRRLGSQEYQYAVPGTRTVQKTAHKILKTPFFLKKKEKG